MSFGDGNLHERVEELERKLSEREAVCDECEKQHDRQLFAAIRQRDEARRRADELERENADIRKLNHLLRQSEAAKKTLIIKLDCLVLDLYEDYRFECGEFAEASYARRIYDIGIEV